MDLGNRIVYAFNRGPTTGRAQPHPLRSQMHEVCHKGRRRSVVELKPGKSRSVAELSMK